MKILGVILLLIMVILYEKLWRVRICDNKIRDYIKNLGGELKYIDRLTPRDEIFCITYTLNGLKKTSTVKFNFFYKEDWY